MIKTKNPAASSRTTRAEIPSLPTLTWQALYSVLIENEADTVGQQQLLTDSLPYLCTTEQDELAEALKKHADQLRRASIHRCLQTVELLHHLARLTGNPLHQALGLLAEGNAYTIGLGEYQKGLDCYDQAAAIYSRLGYPVKQAQSQTGKIWVLANLGRYDEALAIGQWASEVLENHKEWLLLANLTTNMALIPGRLGQDAEALALFDRAAALYHRLGADGELPLLMIKVNRGIVLRNLGRFSESIEVHQEAMAAYRQLGQIFSAAQAQQNLAMTYFVLGRYNEALALLDEVREVFLADGRRRHVMLVDLFISDCLLQLRRFADALEKCTQARAWFSQLGTHFEVGQAIFNEATAYVGLGRYTEALTTLSEARRLFEQEGNEVAVANTDLQGAAVLLCQAQPAAAFKLAHASAAVFRAHDLPIGQARAYLVAARAAMVLNRDRIAHKLVTCALTIGQRHQMPPLTYQAHHLRGLLAVKAEYFDEGLAAYEQAIDELERLYGRLMIEFRADFAQDKERIYEDIVSLCIDLDRPELALEYSERARSRALQQLLALRLDLSIEARSEADRPLVAELQQLRAERNRLYRRWETGEEIGQRGQTDELLAAQNRVEQHVLDLEKRITTLWHKLLVRNADYARDAALWQVRTEPIQPYLDPQTVLVEYFIAHEELIVFLVTADTIQAHRLPTNLTQVQHLLQLLWLNLRAVPQSPPVRLPHLTRNAEGILQKLYQQLVGGAGSPLAETIATHPRLIIVPYGPLHYLPFHALHDGRTYLLQQHEISYLPGASLLRYCQERRSTTTTSHERITNSLLAVGHSSNGRLPHTVNEAKCIAHLWPGETGNAPVITEADATLARLRELAPHSHVLHLATHGDFRPDNPLFSGLALDDGWLTTLDIFSLRLQASLVTLSACQTGRSVIGGGDELLGLMRAFLSAGAASLVATLWAVEDVSTAQMMASFYQKLAAGETKGAALRAAQQSYLAELAEAATPDRRHPYFWAPFFLVGDAGPL